MTLSRRLLVAAAASGLFAARSAAQPAPARFASISVDVTRLDAQGFGAQAHHLRSALTGALRDAFSGRIGRPGPALVVRITGLSLRSYAGGGSSRWGFGGGGDTDYLDGEAVIVGPHGAVLARYPQLSALPSSSGGAWYDPASERRRIEALARHYAGWLVRAIPG
jgi:hypothetical protein